MEQSTKKSSATQQKARIPQAEQDLATLANRVAPKFVASGLTLDYITPAAFLVLTSKYDAELQARLDTKGDRRPITVRIEELDELIDAGVEDVKGYLVYKYQKPNAPQYYGSFGIVHRNQSHEFPRDQSTCVHALATMIQGIQTHGFNNERFGLAWWQDIQARYNLALAKAAGLDGDASSKVSTKNTTKAEVKKVLNSLVHIIMGNYPDDYKAKLREWGFQKEKY